MVLSIVFIGIKMFFKWIIGMVIPRVFFQDLSSEAFQNIEKWLIKNTPLVINLFSLLLFIMHHFCK